MTHTLMKAAFAKIIPEDNPQQALRLRRYFMALTMYMLCAFLAYLSYLANIMEWRTILGFLIIIPAINITFYIVFRTGLNLRMTDPSLTSAQIYCAILVTMFGMYYANEARGFLLLVYVLILLFGIFRLNTRQFLFVSAFSLLTYGVNIVLLYNFRPEQISFTIEYLQLGVLAIVLLAFSVVAGHISALRRQLSVSKAELKKSVSAIREMAIRDDLTDCFNRRHLMELVEYEKNRSERTGTVFSLIMADIDHFKNVNDIYGHQIGDQVLRGFAATIRSALRSTDFCGRYGGEEFLIVLTLTNLSGAKVFAERLRYLVETSSFVDSENKIWITVSLGLAERQALEDPETTIQRADSALYKAKSKGRNRVEYE
jgi:diguanylate cyclase (GGDEF)-like protein